MTVVSARRARWLVVVAVWLFISCGRSDWVVAEVGAAEVDLGGEVVRVANGWSATVYRDFSDELAYSEDDFPSERGHNRDNDPNTVVILEPPFAPGLAIAAGRSILEIRHSDLATIEHDYAPTTANADGPDEIARLAHSPAGLTGHASLVVSASSLDEGDGLFEVDASWELTNFDRVNNTRAVIADPEGRFDATGTAEHYVGRNASVVRLSNDGAIALGVLIAGRVAENGDLYLALADDSYTFFHLVRMESEVHVQTELLSGDVILRLPAIAPSGTDPPSLFILRDNAELGTLDGNGNWVPILETLDREWRWSDAALALPGSALAEDGAALYVLSSNRALDRDRVLRFLLP